jgi:hypothetical protein
MKTPVFLLLSVVLLTAVPPAVIHAEQLNLEFLHHQFGERRVETSCRLTGSLSYDIVDAIRNGLTAKLSVTFRLKYAPGFIDIRRQYIREKTDNFTISYDVWEDSFIVYDRRRRSNFSVRSSAQIIEKIGEAVSPVQLGSPTIQEGDQLIVRGRIRIQSVKLFPPLGLFLIFYNPWNYESGWFQSDIFVYEMK